MLTPREILAKRLDRKSAVGLRLTINVLIFLLALWAFGSLLDAVLDNETLFHWYLAVNGYFHQHATPLGLAIFNKVTLLGSAGVWTIVPVVAVWLWHRGDYVLLSGWLGTQVGGEVLQYALKTSVHRTRPQYAAQFLHGHSYSFPSGHTMGTTICYPLLMVVLTAALNWKPARRIGMHVLAVAIIAAVGFSRLYLGVHYPSDVMGGLAAGLGWLAACLIGINWAREHWKPTVAEAVPGASKVADKVAGTGAPAS
ncbi:MAG: phosphoesterase PA-phosphatase related protein [Gemmatimonadetes bacterium]|nr:phosphoesterase PA-phosphatase related protein [Gemmatimonadota bacterium]